ncbi:MAG: tRNA-dihydrouridine synthase family protein [Oscillospiraceae bacterium]|nr:tRNA-dihydrouridine synthase family protein [Oscillospiraceae bacterium]
MNHYFAPLEGITDRVYRKLHHRFFPGIDQYYTPFFSPTVHHSLTPKETKELPPAESLGYRAVPQLLTKVPEDFLWMAGKCHELGYKEVNLNVGCPSGTVTAKGKGAGMLADPESLDRFLNEVFAQTSIDISVKTRLGFANADEFPAILEVFNHYPIKHLTVHPRVRNAFYKGNVNLDTFAYAVKYSRAPVCFNGNLNSRKEIRTISQQFPKLVAVMLGRGLIADPGMLTPNGTDIGTLEAFYDALLEEYLIAFGGARNAMFRLKEHWRYLLCKFENTEKLAKQLRKTTDLTAYKAITREIFNNCPIRQNLMPDW